MRVHSLLLFPLLYIILGRKEGKKEGERKGGKEGGKYCQEQEELKHKNYTTSRCLFLSAQKQEEWPSETLQAIQAEISRVV